MIVSPRRSIPARKHFPGDPSVPPGLLLYGRLAGKSARDLMNALLWGMGSCARRMVLQVSPCTGGRGACPRMTHFCCCHCVPEDKRQRGASQPPLPHPKGCENYKRSPLGQLNPEEVQRWGGAVCVVQEPNNKVKKLSEVRPISELLSDVASPLSASHPHTPPPHRRQMAACEACQWCSSNVFYPQIKNVGGFRV